MAGKKKKREPRSPEEKKRRTQARRMIAGTAAGAAVVGAVPILIDNIIKVGATTMAGRTILSALKGVPGIHLAASVLNALVAGTVTYAAGEISAMVFEGIQRGTIDPKTIDWARYIEVLYREKMPEYTELIQEALEKRSAEDVVKNLVKILGRKEKKDSDSGMQNDAGGDR